LTFPFGTGKPLDCDNRVARAALSSWQTGATLTLQTGFPMFINGATGGGRQRDGSAAEWPPDQAQH